MRLLYLRKLYAGLRKPFIQGPRNAGADFDHDTQPVFYGSLIARNKE